MTLRPILPLLALFLCAAKPPPAEPQPQPQPQPRFIAAGQAPEWLIAINSNIMRVTLAPENSTLPLEENFTMRFFKTEGASKKGDALVWEGQRVGEAITMEARPGQCTLPDGASLDYHVTVRVAGRELAGCGRWIPLVSRRRR